MIKLENLQEKIIILNPFSKISCTSQCSHSNAFQMAVTQAEWVWEQPVDIYGGGGGGQKIYCEANFFSGIPEKQTFLKKQPNYTEFFYKSLVRNKIFFGQNIGSKFIFLPIFLPPP